MSGSGVVEGPLDPAWFDAIASRVSRRAFDGRPVDSGTLDRLDATCARLGLSSLGARATLVRETPEGVFTGLVGSYGTITGAPAFLAFVGGEASLVDIGYVGEAAILDATLAGLDTCWVAGNFDAERTGRLVTLAPDERVWAVSPLGYSPQKVSRTERVLHAFVKPRARLPLGQIAPGSDDWPEWARAAAEAVRIAPSGGNAQSWRLRMEADSLVIARKDDRPYWTWPIDCGIAMLHAELGAHHEGISGTWSHLTEPDVASFTPSDRDTP